MGVYDGGWTGSHQPTDRTYLIFVGFRFGEIFFKSHLSHASTNKQRKEIHQQ